MMFKKIATTLIVLLTVHFVNFAQSSVDQINKIMNDWHHAAAVANASTFFGTMSEQGIYIGTDSWERWNKTEFEAFAKPYFDRGQAWDFKPTDRQVFISDDGKTAWFSELLDTWMGICRGSGILTLRNNEWKIEQYHLSVTVPNEEIQSFLKLVQGKQKTSKE